MSKPSLDRLNLWTAMGSRGRLGLCVAAACAFLGSDLSFAQTSPPMAGSQLGEFISRVCPDGWDEDFRPNGPVLVLTGDQRGGNPIDDDWNPAARTPFVLYGDDTLIAGVLLHRKGRPDGWRHTKYRLDHNAVAELKRSLTWKALSELDSNYAPVAKEEERWVKEHHCFGACWPVLELHLWSEGCRKTISVSGIDHFFMQFIALGIAPPFLSNDAERFAMAQLAFRRLPAVLRRALRRMGNFRLSGGTTWCEGDDCLAKSLPWHESWGLRAKFFIVRPPSDQNEPEGKERTLEGDPREGIRDDAVEPGVGPDGRSPAAPARRSTP